MLTYNNGGMCECCYIHCIYCMGDMFEYSTPQCHHPDTKKCPKNKEEAEQNKVLNYMKYHEGFKEDEIKIKLNDKSPHPPHLFTNEFTGGVIVTHINGMIEIEPGRTYREPLERALKRLRKRVDGISPQ